MQDLDPDDPRPPYQQVANALRTGLEADAQLGDVGPADRLAVLEDHAAAKRPADDPAGLAHAGDTA